MKRNFFVYVATLGLAVGMSGCAGFAGWAGVNATNGGGIMSNMTVPSGNHSGTAFRNDGPGFDIVGQVSAEGQTTNILGWIANGDAGYKTLLEKAKASGGDAVIDYYYDAKLYNILTFYSKVDFILYGTAVKYKKGR
jgi:hypothetical protein